MVCRCHALPWPWRHSPSAAKIIKPSYSLLRYATQREIRFGRCRYPSPRNGIIMLKLYVINACQWLAFSWSALVVFMPICLCRQTFLAEIWASSRRCAVAYAVFIPELNCRHFADLLYTSTRMHQRLLSSVILHFCRCVLTQSGKIGSRCCRLSQRPSGDSAGKQQRSGKRHLAQQH